MMYVVCFYWQGDRWQTQNYVKPEGHVNRQHLAMRKLGTIDKSLPSQYVNSLYRGVSRFADRDFKFVCFTNEELEGLHEGIEIRNFPMLTQEGVLPRLYMFSKEAGLFGHQVLCLDLDVVIVGSLANLMEYDGLFCARTKFRIGQEDRLDGDIMSFRAGRKSEKIFWDPFVQDIPKAVDITKGRERYWVRYVAGDIADTWREFAPDQVISYKWHVQKTGRVPLGAAIVSCHGVPRPHQITQSWIKQYW